MKNISKNLKSELNKVMISLEDISEDDFYVYQPREDSDMLLQSTRQKIKQLNKSLKILELGVGSGYIAFNLISEFDNLDYHAVDLNPDAVNFVKKYYQKSKFKSKLTVKQSDLFENVKGKYDIIIFNPPYLPKQKNEPYKMSLALSGGTLGHETTEKFLQQARKFLKKNGIMQIIVTSLNAKYLKPIIERELFQYKTIKEEKYDFEKLYVYELEQDDLAKKYPDIQVFAEGWHSYIYRYDKYIIKKSKLNDARYQKEKMMLQRLSKYNIGPKIVDLGLDDNYLCYEFVPGILLKDYMKDLTLEKIKQINKILLPKIIRLDSLGIKKEELTRITSNAIINKNKITLIDFERSKFTKTNDNFPQYLEFIRHLLSRLKLNPKIVDLKEYKKLENDYDLLLEKAKLIMNNYAL